MDYWSDDDWFYESIKRYNTLLMFDFSSAAKFIEFNSLDNICIIFDEKNEHNEISCLALPKKLTVSKDQEGLEKDSDLKVLSGGFSHKPLVQVKTLHGKNTLVASETDQCGISVYDIPSENSGIIRRKAIIDCELDAPNLAYNKIDSLAVMNTNKKGFLFDTKEFLIKGKIKFEDDKEESRVHPEYISPHLLSLCNTESGTIVNYDTRSEKITSLFNTDQSSQKAKWTLSSSFHSSPYIGESTDESKLGLLSTSGIIYIHDTRNSQGPLCCGKGEDLCSTLLNNSKPKLRFSPSNLSLISVSGFNSNIHIYDFSSKDLKTVFVHDGHNRNGQQNDSVTTDHIWYKNSIISSCDNLSVHCWEYTR